LRNFRVDLRGENYLVKFEDKQTKKGFYTSIWVKAKNPEEAHLEAVKVVQNQKDLNKIILNPKDDSPMIYLEEIVELRRDEKLKKNKGRVWFSGTEDRGEVKYLIRKRWFEFWK